MQQIEELMDVIAAREDGATEEESSQVIGLVDDVNQLIEDTACIGNKLFAMNDEDLSFSIGNGSVIALESRLMEISVTDIDIPSMAATMVTETMGQLFDINEELESTRVATLLAF